MSRSVVVPVVVQIQRTDIVSKHWGCGVGKFDGGKVFTSSKLRFPPRHLMEQVY